MSEEKTDIPNELFESVREAVGRRVKLTLRRKVQLEVKGDKVEKRVLALASHRVYLLTARVPSKVEQSFSYLDIQGFSSNKPTQLVLEHERGPCSLRLGSVEEVDEVIAHIGSCLHRICPTGSPVKVMKKLSLKPPERTAALQAIWDEQGSTDLGPCGGFSHQYWCVCDHLGLPYREEVQWDVDTIYLTQDTRELNLQDFIHLENRDLVAIIAALEYNQWFTKLSTKDYKLSTDVCDQILRVLARSSRLEELVLDNAGLKRRNCSEQLNSPNCPLGTGFSEPLQRHVSLRCEQPLSEALCANPVASRLLDLAGSSLRGDDLPRSGQCLSWLDISGNSMGDMRQRCDQGPADQHQTQMEQYLLGTMRHVNTCKTGMMDMMCVKCGDHLNSLSSQRPATGSGGHEDLMKGRQELRHCSQSVPPEEWGPGILVLEPFWGQTGSMAGGGQGDGRTAAVKEAASVSGLKAGAGMTIPAAYVTTTLLGQSGVGIINRSGYFIEPVTHLIRKGQPLLLPRSLRWRQRSWMRWFWNKNHDQGRLIANPGPGNTGCRMDTCMMTLNREEEYSGQDAASVRCIRLPSVRVQPQALRKQQISVEFKRFLALIKSRTSRSEKEPWSCAITPPPCLLQPFHTSSSVSPVTEEVRRHPTPRPPVKCCHCGGAPSDQKAQSSNPLNSESGCVVHVLDKIELMTKPVRHPTRCQQDTDESRRANPRSEPPSVTPKYLIPGHQKSHRTLWILIEKPVPGQNALRHSHRFLLLWRFTERQPSEREAKAPTATCRTPALLDVEFETVASFDPQCRCRARCRRRTKWSSLKFSGPPTVREEDR
ncbi:F-actin-uncapping protein LRRC16A-like protein [Lates japonicus]|uniref:F-actin-uncapping protein LRRC16A-like protein n=1 Tax=Lates japonicus TaxID=270547 RepID=A0AAD3RMJ5_LATJO|nr:F-actin-uncapping protein LRRC16A-like protein [Lates japonicus]